MVNSEHKHSEIERFSTLNELIVTFWMQHHFCICFGFKSMPLFSD